MFVNEIGVEIKPPKLEPTRLNVIGKVRWAAVRAFMSTVGRTSDGVRTGYKYGFNSGKMLDYVYLNQARGKLGIGKVLDRIYLNAIGWRAIRNRRELLQKMLRAELNHLRANEQEIRLLDVAAGPGTYLQDLLKEDPANFRVLCRDLDPDGLDKGRQEARAAGLTGITFEVGDAFNPAPTTDTLGGPPNLLVVSGLYEQFTDDETVKKSLQTFFKTLAPGGKILLTTQLQHPMLDFVVNVMPSYTGQTWLLKCRPIGKVEGWLRQAGFEAVNSQVEREGLCAVTAALKPA